MTQNSLIAIALFSTLGLPLPLFVVALLRILNIVSRLYRPGYREELYLTEIDEREFLSTELFRPVEKLMERWIYVVLALLYVVTIVISMVVHWQNQQSFDHWIETLAVTNLIFCVGAIVYGLLLLSTSYAAMSILGKALSKRPVEEVTSQKSLWIILQMLATYLIPLFLIPLSAIPCFGIVIVLLALIGLPIMLGGTNEELKSEVTACYFIFE